MRMADSTAAALTTGKEPGSPRQTGHTWELGAPPNVVGHPQNILVSVFELHVDLEAEDGVELRDRLLEHHGRASHPRCSLQGGTGGVQPVVGHRPAP
jgi:hypothetical protein